jgi:hypothetical protein
MSRDILRLCVVCLLFLIDLAISRSRLDLIDLVSPGLVRPKLQFPTRPNASLPEAGAPDFLARTRDGELIQSGVFLFFALQGGIDRSTYRAAVTVTGPGRLANLSGDYVS